MFSVLESGTHTIHGTNVGIFTYIWCFFFNGKYRQIYHIHVWYGLIYCNDYYWWTRFGFTPLGWLNICQTKSSGIFILSTGARAGPSTYNYHCLIDQLIDKNKAVGKCAKIHSLRRGWNGYALARETKVSRDSLTSSCPSDSQNSSVPTE